ncbi:MAG: DUF4399 domain-containing protein [Pseudomonadota bacterium]|nr:DUF4399 domain-containing protein [Pseudomonadota bacterium]
MKRLMILALAALAVPAATRAEPVWPAGAKVYIISPQDGATVRSPVKVVFGLSGMGVAPAGVEQNGTGHHHLLINRDVPTGDDLLAPLPAEDGLRHFGGGQTEAMVELAPGKHTLQLIMGDWSHVPGAMPLISERISITVE